MNYQSSWLEKSKKLPQEILSRLDLHASKTFASQNNKQGLYRALVFGIGAEFFIPAFNSYLDQSRWKIFVSNVSKDFIASHQSTNSAQGNLIYIKEQSIKYLSSFPPKTFDLIISLWSFQPSHNIDFSDLLTDIHHLLKDKGLFSIVTYLDGSPELPLRILKSIIKHHRNWPLKIFKSTLPISASEFRKMLNKSKLGVVRIWKDNIICDYLSAEEIYNDIFVLQEGLFLDTVPSQYVSTIKEEFIRELKTCSFPLKIAYDFVGAISI